MLFVFPELNLLRKEGKELSLYWSTVIHIFFLFAKKKVSVC